MISTAEKTETGLKSMLLILITLSLCIAGPMKYFIIFMNSFQLIIHLPIMNVVVPANLGKFFKIMCPIATYDIIGSDVSTEKVFTFDFKSQEKNGEDIITDQLSDLGYGTTNCLLCLETIGPLILIYYIKVFIWWFFLNTIDTHLSCARKCRPIKYVHEALRKTLFFEEFITIGL